MKRRLPPLLLACCALLPAAHASNGPAQSTYGTKGPVSLAADGDGQSAFRMPSGLGWSLNHRVDFDLFWFWGTSNMRNGLNDADKSDGTLAGSLALVLAPGRPREGDKASWEGISEQDQQDYGFDPSGKWTFHTGLYVELGGGSGDKAQIRFTTFPDKIGLRTEIQYLTVPFTVAFTPRRWISFGAAIHLIRAKLGLSSLVGGDSTPLEGSPTINGVPIPGNPTYADFLQIFASNDATDPTTVVRGDVDGFQFGAVLSVSLRPVPNFAVGLAWRPPTWAPFDLEGELTVNASRTFEQALGGLNPTLRQLFLDTLPNQGTQGYSSTYDAELAAPTPPQWVRLCLNWWPIDSVLLGCELAWVDWHGAFGTADIVMKNGDNTDLNFVIGSNQVQSNLKLRWNNQWIFAGYAAWSPLDFLTLRLGLSHSTSAPLNEDFQGSSPTPGFVVTNLSLGAGVRWGGWEFSFLYEHGFYASVHSSDRPLAVSSKRNHYGAAQHFFHFGVSYRF